MNTKAKNQVVLIALVVAMLAVLVVFNTVQAEENEVFTTNYFLSYYNKDSNAVLIDVVADQNALDNCNYRLENGDHCRFDDGLMYSIVLSYSETPNNEYLENVGGFEIIEIVDVNPYHEVYTQDDLYNSALMFGQNLTYVFSGNLELAWSQDDFPEYWETNEYSKNLFYVEYPQLLIDNVITQVTEYTIFLPMIVK